MKNITYLLFSFFLFSLNSIGQSVSNYDISVTTIWNSTDHTSLPGNAHWSPLAGATHKNPNDILEFNAVAPMTNGIKNIAETGSTTNFQSEVNTIITAGNADQYLQQGFSPFAGNNSISAINNVLVNEDFPLITLVSMVAPSPDWFIAVNSLSLRSGNDAINNGWKETFTIDIFAYDAGTDSGTDYTSANFATSPRAPITILSGFPINQNKMATMTFTYNSSTLSDKLNKSFNNIKIYPNPTRGNITISNLQNIDLKTIEVYNVLGKIIKRITPTASNSKIDINLSTLNKGLYLLKLKTITGTTTTQKIIVE